MKRLLTFLRIGSDLIRVSVRGEGEGPPLLLIMGLGGNIEMWDPLETTLNSEGVQTISYDSSGTGDSPPRLLPMRMPGLARQATRILDALGHPEADVLGVSFGGAVAQQLALSNPHRVRRLILVSTMCGLGGVPGNPLALSILATPLRYYSPRFMRLVAPTLYGPSARSDEELLRRQSNARRARPPHVWSYVQQISAVAGWTSLPWLHRIVAPTLVMAGSDDSIVPPVNARMLAKRIPGSTLEITQGAGHLVLLEHPDSAARTIAKFVSPN